MSIETKQFGTTSDGALVTMYSLTNKNGMKADFIDYGAILVNLFVPSKDGKLLDVVLGFDNIKSYEINPPFFGSFIGRHANRIGGAAFTLNGVKYDLEKNDGANTLHGGTPGYNKVMYQAETASIEGKESVSFSRRSKDMEQGYPGNLDVKVTYTLTDDNVLEITYDAVSDKDTLVNLTNHSYFNLAGHGSGKILDHKVRINAKQFTPTSKDLIPQGEFTDVKGTPMDFTKLTRIGDGIDADYEPIVLAGGYDHNFVLDKKDGALDFAAELVEEQSGRRMEVYTDLPGMQFYTGNFIMGENGKENAFYEKRDGACFETQFFPNSCNVSEFKSCAVKANEPFHSVTKYAFF